MKFLLVTDLDHTLVGDDEATQVLNQRLHSKRSQICLVYSTGRSHASTCELIAQKQLLEPDYLIAGVGSEIYQNGALDLDWAEYLSQDWDKMAIASLAKQFSQLKSQSLKEQNPWKISYCLEPTAENSSTLQELQQKLTQSRLAAQIIFSSNRDVDILPHTSNKGNALTYLQKRLQIPSEATLVCGDSGNDISMFEQDVRGVIVANALSELLDWHREYGTENHYLAGSDCAWGIMEGMAYFWEF
ncbi:sucrose-phosphate phosphatase [Microcoleus asticus]|uniref:sucrose-phosphate phosphatase n=1 Tax=Microcoleus asticus IPMA8 TaxID=2563858 RepID=A0ABX2CWV4_9CYAN|nr:sucrose-phosphate phosphatase [Microcoleus asticus]NQE34050.1 Mannosylfructose-phosphate phosphatase [Microcoleus asticus IPMA8]